MANGNYGGLPTAPTTTSALADGPGALGSAWQSIGVNSGATAWEWVYHLKTDRVIAGSGSAATDLTNLNAAITAVAATSTAQKVIRIHGTFKIGATAPNSFDDITLIFDRVEITGALSSTGFIGTRGKVYIGQLDVNGGSVSSSGMFQCEQVHATVASGFSSNTVFGAIAGAGTHITNLVNIHNLSATAVYNFNASDYGGAIVNISGVASGAQTFASDDMIITTKGCASTNALTVSGVRNRLNSANSKVMVISGNATRAYVDSSGSASTMNISGDACIVHMASDTGGLTLTVSGDNVSVVSQRVDTLTQSVVLSGTKHNISIGCLELETTSNTATQSVYEVREAAGATAETWTLGTSNNWTVNSNVSAYKRTLATSALGTVFNLVIPGDASADAVEIAATCDNTTFNIILTGSGSGLQVMEGATGNTIFTAGNTAPTFETARARYENNTTWLDTSTGVVTHYGAGSGKLVTHITAAEIVAIGAATAGNLTVGTLPISGKVVRGYALNLGSAATGVSTLTAQVGTSGTPNLYVTDATVFAANAVSETLGTATVSHTATTAVIVRFTAAENLNTLTGLANGIAVVLDYQE